MVYHHPWGRGWGKVRGQTLYSTILFQKFKTKQQFCYLDATVSKNASVLSSLLKCPALEINSLVSTVM